MLGLFIFFIIFFGINISYYNNQNLFLKILVSSILLIEFLLAKSGSFITQYSFILLYLTILVIVLMNFKSVIRLKIFRKIFFCQIFFLFYLIIKSLFLSSNYLFDLTKWYFFVFLIYTIFLIKKDKFDFKSIGLFVFDITFLLIVLGFLQFFFPPIKDFFVIDMTQFGYPADIDVFNQGVIGLYTSPSHFGNIITLLLTYILFDESTIVSSLKRFTIILLGLILLFLTGVKSPFLILIILIVVYSVLKKNFKLIFFVIIAFISISSYWIKLSNIGYSYDIYSGFDNPITRQLQIFHLLSSGDLNNVSTLKISADLLNSFFSNMIFGTDPQFIKSLKYESITDVYLLYHLTAFGIFGFLLLMLPYYFIAKGNRLSKILIITCVMQTIVDPGIFYPLINLLLMSLILFSNIKYETK